MKLNKIILGVIVSLITSFLIGTTQVQASSLTRESIPGVYGIFISDDYYSFGGEIYRIDGKIAYCIQPGVKITTDQYVGGSDQDVSFNEEQRKYIQLVAYYGYQYPGHDDITYYLAAQELIWEKAVIGGEGYFTTTQDVHGDRINIEYEKQMILDLISRHDHKPSFDGQNIVVKRGEVTTLLDTNSVLSDYVIDDEDSSLVSINGNQLVIDGNTMDIHDMDITLHKKQYVNNTVSWYYAGNSQKMVVMSQVDAISSHVSIKISGGKLRVFKEGEQLQIEEGGFQYSSTVLSGVSFDLYQSDETFLLGKLLGSFRTLEDGSFETYLDNGYYCLVETTSVMDHIVEPEPHCFLIDDSKDVFITLSFKNYLPKGNAELWKKDSITEEGIPLTLMELYTEDDQLVFSGYTDEKGYIFVDDLFLGTFYWMEKQAHDGYLLTDQKIYFQLTDHHQSVVSTFSNVRIPVPNTGLSEMNMGGIILFMMMGYFGYEIKKKEN